MSARAATPPSIGIGAPASGRPAVGAARAGTRSGGRRRHRSRTLLAVALATVVAIGLLLSVSVYTVRGSTMHPALEPDDRIVVNVFGTPDVGEIVVVGADPSQRRRDTVARVVGGAGDTIAHEGCRLLRDGEPVAEPYLAPAVAGDCGPRQPPIRVPAGHVFVLGDNRGAASDSRDFGPVPVDDVVGTLAFRV